MELLIASDHAGFDLKQEIIQYLHRNHVTWRITDQGPHTADAVDYPIYAHRVASAVSQKEARRGILICGTGLGMSMMANRFYGVRAALCINRAMAEKSREHNRSNILCLAARLVEQKDNLEIVNTWLQTDFHQSDRHLRRVELMDQLQRT